MSTVVRVAVTGAAGRVANSLVLRLASGEVFGPNTKVILHLLEVPVSVAPKAMPTLEGVGYELIDCAFPTLQDVIVTDDPNKAFSGINWALLVGAAPRGPGMQRSDLLKNNGKIFVGQGKAIAENAASDVRILVVGNPCNTNCLVAYRNGQSVPADRWHAMTRLDHNRAVAALALKAGVPNETVTNMTIWGNHSNTQFPDFTNAKIGGKKATEVITDRAWLEGTFVPATQERGKFIIDKTGVSSSFSAANGAIDHVKAFVTGTKGGDWTSAAVVSNGEYGVPKGLVFGYPVTTSGGNWKVVEGLTHDEFGKAPFAMNMNRVEIRYCTKCRWLLRAAWMAQELLTTFDGDIGELVLIPGDGGLFQVSANGQLVWDRKVEGRFPEITELKQRVRDQVAPGRDLGHADRKGTA